MNKVEQMKSRIERLLERTQLTTIKKQKYIKTVKRWTIQVKRASCPTRPVHRARLLHSPGWGGGGGGGGGGTGSLETLTGWRLTCNWFYFLFFVATEREKVIKKRVLCVWVKAVSVFDCNLQIIYKPLCYMYVYSHLL